jgi:hypothetical protein
MNYLIEKGLLNTGRLELTPTMLGRYNDALVTLGIEPTKRKKIFVDGAGWSHEVAREKRNNYYLCSGGLINPAAIIVSPDQYKKPVFFPAFSWMRPALRLFFEKYYREICDVTATHAIPIDCENGLSSLECPGDLLLLSEVLLKPQNEELTKIAKRQEELVVQFGEELNCLETEMCDAVITHRREHGDLRKRRLVMHPVNFDYCNDFYSAAFGGVAVIRGVAGKDMLIVESEEQFASMERSTRCGGAPSWYLYETHKKRDPIRHLMGADLITIPIDTFRMDPRILEEKKELMLALALCDCEEGLDWEKASSSKRKALYTKHEDQVPLLAELERFMAGLRNGTSDHELSDELALFLATPSTKLPAATQEVLWILLTRREPRNMLELYTFDKNHFVEMYQDWKPARRKWVADYLASRYSPRMLQP